MCLLGLVQVRTRITCKAGRHGPGVGNSLTAIGDEVQIRLTSEGGFVTVTCNKTDRVEGFGATA